MPIETLFLLCIYVAVLTGTPGPGNLMLLACGTNFPVRRSLGFLAGTLAGFLSTFTLTAAGLLAVVISVPVLWDGLRIACIGYILYLAWVIAIAKPKTPDAPKNAPGFWRGFFVHPLNPKAYAMQVAAISQFVTPERYTTDALTAAATFLIVGGSMNFSWLAGGKLLARLARNPTHFRILNVSLAALMVVSTLASLHMA